MRESTLTFSEFNFPKRWSIGKVSVKSLMFKHFVKVVWTVFVVSVVVDTASLSAEIGTDTGNKGNIILGNVLSKTRNYHSFFKLSSANFSLRKSRKQFWIFEGNYTETYTDPHWHTPTQNNVTPIQNNLSRAIRKCQTNYGWKIDPENLKWLKLAKNVT